MVRGDLVAVDDGAGVVVVVWVGIWKAWIYFKCFLDVHFLLTVLLVWVQEAVGGVRLSVVCWEFHDEHEIRTFSKLGPASDSSIEHFDNFLGDVQTQSYTFGVDFFCCVQKTEQFE